MRLSKLYVEGKLDSEIYTPLFSGAVTIEKGGSKTSIRPQARNDRSSGILAGYLRDRDFDFDPPDDMDIPTIDLADGDVPWGWRLNRHEIESYILDPQVVAAKFGIEAEAWQDHLCEAGKIIRWYQIARWTIGYARSGLPPNYKLQTSPNDVNEMRLPADLSEQASLDWGRQVIAEFRARVDQNLCEQSVNDKLESNRLKFTEELLSSHAYVLAWCSGKDLFAALPATGLQQTGAQNPKTLCNILRDWVRDHSDEFIGFFPEIAALKQQVTGTSPPEESNESRPLRRIELNDENNS